MTEKFYLSRPGMISSLGSGISDSLHALFTGKPDELLSSGNAWVQDKTLRLGAVRTALPNLLTVPAAFRSRNNQLLAATLHQIDTPFQAACKRYGRERIAAVIGTSTTAADENNPAFRQYLSGTPWQATDYLHARHQMSNPADFAAWCLQLQGSAYSISTACTSGARALISAARLLRLGVCDAVVCGGVDTLSQLTINGFHSLEVLSDGISNPFSKQRNGINIGEASAVFVMTRERLSADDLLLLSYGASSDAYHMSSPHPQGAGAIAAIEAALSAGSLNAADIGWINLHGTGTVQNDAMESLAVAATLGTNIPCTSTKPLSGHTLGAAGALEAALLWAVISRDDNPHGRLPEHHWDGQADEALPALRFCGENDCWSTSRRIGLSASYAFGGNNAVLIIGEE
ncbi:MAG: beta-ketoacyl-ACP synthase [Neisseria sp.]|nr:beta-ketoacyl-ACP synthase [Neisseria sp.]